MQLEFKLNRDLTNEICAGVERKSDSVMRGPAPARPTLQELGDMMKSGFVLRMRM